MGSMNRIIAPLIFAAMSLGLTAVTARAQDIVTACGVVSGDTAQKFVGGPLDVKEEARVPLSNGPSAYTSVCTYIARGTAMENALAAPRLLDLTLHFLDSAETMAIIYENSVVTYTQLANTPDGRFKNPTISYLAGFGDKAFVFEAVTDPQSGFKSALIVFQKGHIGGSIAAAKKPESALETSKAVLKYILSRLP